MNGPLTFLTKLSQIETFQISHIFIFFSVNFKNLFVKFYVSYDFNMRIKFCSNWILFIIRSINLFCIHNFRS